MKKLVSLFGKKNEMNIMLNDRAKEYAAQNNIEYIWEPMDPFTEDAAVAALENADAGLIDIEVYDKAIFSRIQDSVKLMIRFGVGYDAVNIPDATEAGIKVAITKGANASAVAEYALLMIMVLRRKLLVGYRGMQVGDWTKPIGHELFGNTVGILGFGAVGKIFAASLKGFNCRILAYDVYRDEKAASELGVEFANPETIFKEADAITVHLALNDDTRHFVNEDRLSLMKPEAVIVNTSRGPIIDDEALITALKEHKIGGAGLDVFSEEPLPLDSEYMSLDNVILSPHIASSTVESLWNIYKTAIDITDDFFSDKHDDRLKGCYLN